MVERYTSRALITQTLVGYAMPAGSHQEPEWEGYRLGHVNILTGPLSHIAFDHGPIQSITSIETIDTDNSEALYPATSYYLDNYDEDIMPRVRFNSDAAAPNSLRAYDAWKIEFVAGYGDNSSDVPPDIRRAITMLAGYLWGNRGACPDGKCVENCGASSKLNKFRLDSFVS